MNHDEAFKLIVLYRDGELDMPTCVKLEEHMADCAICQQKLTAEEELVNVIQTETPRFEASPFLKTRIQAALREERKKEESPSARPFNFAWIFSGLASGALALLLGVAVLMPPGMPGVSQEAITDHVRSLQANHLLDVRSTDQHTVKPWFAGKLDYSPQVVDLAASGYPLIGGRLDVLDHRNVAAIIYQRRKHYINLFIWPSDGKSLQDRLYNKDGYHVLGWTKSNMNYLAVSEVGEKELRDFVGMIQEQTVETRPGE